MDADIAYDSDTIDEDLEARLYASVYFDNEENDLTESNSPVSTNGPILSQSECDVKNAHDFVFKTPLPPAQNESFSWKFPPDVEERATSLSSLADAVYFTLTGELPPSVAEASRRKLLQNASSRNLDSAEIVNTSFTTNEPQIPTSNTDESKNIIFNLPDSDSDSDDSSKEPPDSLNNDSSVIDSSDIILSVSNSENSSSMFHTDSATVIAEMLKHTSSDPCQWHLDPLDRTPSFRNDRYYDASRNAVCGICFKKGHSDADCSRSGPVCILCGREGHMSNYCANQYCSACLRPGHSYAECPLKYRMRVMTCSRCLQIGHTRDICSEIWRQYKETTKTGKPVISRDGARRSVDKSCCNCGRRGHISDDCRDRPFRGMSLVRRAIRVYDKRNVYSGNGGSHVAMDPPVLKHPRRSEAPSGQGSCATTGRQSANLSFLSRQRGRQSWPLEEPLASELPLNSWRALREARQEKLLAKATRRVERKLLQQSLMQQQLQQQTSYTVRDRQGRPDESGSSFSTPLSDGNTGGRFDEPLILSIESPSSRWAEVGGNSGTPFRSARKRRNDDFVANTSHPTFSRGGGKKRRASLPNNNKNSNNNNSSTPKSSAGRHIVEDRGGVGTAPRDFRFPTSGSRLEKIASLPNISASAGSGRRQKSGGGRPVEEELWYKTIVTAPKRISSWRSPKPRCNGDALVEPRRSKRRQSQRRLVHEKAK